MESPTKSPQQKNSVNSWFPLQHTLQCESRTLCCSLTAMTYWSNFFENWQVWNMLSPAKYFHKHAFSVIFPTFYTHFTASVAPLLIFSNNNDRKGKSCSKILYEEIEVFLKTSANAITLGVFFSLYSWSFLTKLKLFSL